MAKQAHDLGFQKRQDKLKDKRERSKKTKQPATHLNRCYNRNHAPTCTVETCPDNLTDMRAAGRR